MEEPDWRYEENNSNEASTTNEIKKAENILREENIKFAILFGSYARNEQKEHSDIDIAIISPKENNIIHTVRLSRKIKEETERKTEVFPIKELEEKTLGKIAHEGKPLIDKNNKWKEFQEKYKDKKETKEEAKEKFQEKYNKVIENG